MWYTVVMEIRDYKMLVNRRRVPLRTDMGLTLQGYRTKMCEVDSSAEFDFGRPEKPAVSFAFLSHLGIDRNEVLLEFVFKERWSQTWRTIAPTVFKNFLEGYIEKFASKLLRDSKLVFVDDEMGRTRPCLAIEVGDGEKKEMDSAAEAASSIFFWAHRILAGMVLFPDKLTTFGAAQDVDYALFSIREAVSDISSGYHDGEINRLLAKQAELRERALQVARDNNEACERAAAALNELAERYGIELDEESANA